VLYPNEPVISHVAADPAVVYARARGLQPRNYQTHPVGYYVGEQPFGDTDIELISEADLPGRIEEQVKAKSRNSDIRMAGNFGKPIPSLNQGSYGYCLPPGTRIRMADGTQKNIEDVQLLDGVLTAEGNVSRVMQLHVREHDGGMTTVKSWGHSHLRMTPNHSVLTARGYVPAGELKTGDKIAVPRYSPEPVSVVLTDGHVKRKSRVLAGGLVGSDYTYKEVPDVIRLTPGFGRILGLWLAEGHVNEGNSLVWSFNVTEADTLAAELVELIRSELGLEASTRPGPGPNVTQVVLCGRLWCQLFVSLCGKLAHGKRLHADIASGPREFLDALFWGWMAGDGSTRLVSDREYDIGTTVSHDLALAMYDIANAAGLRPSIVREEPQKNRHAASRRPAWKVTVNRNPRAYRPDYRSCQDDKHVWRTVRGVETVPYKGTVYNIGVEGDNSYVAEGVGVHNCWGHSGTSAHMGIRAQMNLPYVKLSAFSVCATIKRGANQGGWGAQGLDFINQRGQMTQAEWPEGNADYRSLGTDTKWAEAKRKYRITEGFADMSLAQYDRNLTYRQVLSCLVNNIWLIMDFNWWGHSVAGADAVNGSEQRPFFRDFISGKKPQLVTFDAVWGMNDATVMGIGVRIWNSWADSWGAMGMSVLTGSKAVPNGCTAPRAATMSVRGVKSQRSYNYNFVRKTPASHRQSR
jgi:hypothetical protein